MKKILLAFTLVVALVSQPISIAQSQSEGDIRINLVSTLETPEATILKLYFNLYDTSSSTPVFSLDAQEAEVMLLNTGYTSVGQIKQPDVPIYITLLLDSSGSMGGSAQTLQEAAKLALTNIPDNSLFGVVQFDEEIKLLQDFTANVATVSYAIDQYKVSNKGTCLYDAAYAAVEAQAKAPPGRRAVILFTDGKDEKHNGSQCSQHSYQELIALATQMQVPVHTIGLSSDDENINEVELKNLALSTGGFSYIASKDDLTQSFAKIMEALKAQWMVEANVYPKKGKNEAVFRLTLSDGTTLTKSFSFNAENDYPGPPSPVKLQFAGLQLMAETQSYDIQLTISSPELVSYVKISLWDQDAGSKIDEYVFENLATFNTLNIPADKLTAEGQYELRIIAVGEDGIPFEAVTDDKGNSFTELIHEFSFDPSSIYASAVIESITQQESNLLLNVSLNNTELIGGFDGWLVNEETNAQEPNSSFTNPPLDGSSGIITIPLEEGYISAGKYTVVLRVLNKNGQVFTSSQYEGFVYEVSTALLSIISVKQVEGDLVLDVAVTNPEQIHGFDGWLIDKETNTQVANSNFTSEALPGTEGQITVPTNSRRIRSGKYVVVVRVLGENNEVISTQAAEVTYKARNIFQRIGLAIIAAPIFLALIIGIILAVIAYLMVSSMRQKSLSGTPVIKGQLGGRLKKDKEEGIVLAVADEEPLPQRQSSSQPIVQTPSTSKPNTPTSSQGVPEQTLQGVSSDQTLADGQLNNGQATMITGTVPYTEQPTLIMLRGPLQGKYTINSSPYIIGRAEDCSMVLSDPNISRRHVQITYEMSHQAYYISDLNSSNGTKLNGQQLVAGQAVQLLSGSTIDVGSNVSIRFEC